MLRAAIIMAYSDIELPRVAVRLLGSTAPAVRYFLCIHCVPRILLFMQLAQDAGRLSGTALPGSPPTVSTRRHPHRSSPGERQSSLA